MTPTREEWKEIEEILSNTYGQVFLTVDGYRVSLVMQRVTQYKLAIVVRVNGELKTEYLTSDREERKRFYCPEERFLYPRKARDSFARIPKKMQNKVRKELAEKGIDLEKKFMVWHIWWTSFKALKAHLVRNNKDITFDKKLSHTFADLVALGTMVAVGDGMRTGHDQ